MDPQQKVLEIIKRLKKVYPNPGTALVYSNPWELLVATMLSAQFTDKAVNNVTPELFKKFPNIKDFADADVSEIDKYISKVIFHANKAKNINSAAKVIMEKHNGKVPEN